MCLALKYLQGKRTGADFRSLGQRGGTVDLVAQLADVAGPRIVQQAAQGVGGEMQAGQVEFLAGVGQQFAGDGNEIAAAFTQRRQSKGYSGEPVVEVATESPVADVGLQVTVRCGDHSHIDAHRRAGADRAKLAFLQNAQQLDLEGRRGVADLVEEQGPAMARWINPM